MVVEGEYLTIDGKSRRTSGHVFMDYRPGYVVYLFTNLIVGMNIHLKQSLMEEISNREDPNGYIE